MNNESLTPKEIDDYREYFRGMDSFSNYQWGGYSSKPVPVLEEVKKWLDYNGSLPADPEIIGNMAIMRENLRSNLAEHLNALTDEITITDHTTIGINIIGWGLNLQKGEAVLLSKGEHPANLIPWYNLKQRNGIVIDFLEVHKRDEDLLTELREKLKKRKYRVISLAHVSRNSGYRLPAKEITSLAHEYGVFVLFDGAQSVGSIPVDVADIGCDAYSFCGHKWLLGPQGTGALYVNGNKTREILPTWVGSKSQETYDLNGNVTWKADMRKHEYGTSAHALYAGWLKSMEMMGELGFERIFKTIENKTQMFKEQLISIDPDLLETPYDATNSSGIVTFNLGGIATREFLTKIWEEEKVLLSPLEDPLLIRACIHFVNSDDEINKLTSYIRDYVNEKTL